MDGACSTHASEERRMLNTGDITRRNLEGLVVDGGNTKIDVKQIVWSFV
jgi:hypothetical protein